jgi:hypothetical protein
MLKITYTMFVGEVAGTEEIVAQGVTLPRALVLALEHGGRGRATIVHGDIGPLRYFAIGRRPAGGHGFECAAHTVVERSDNHGSDADRAFEVFEQVLLKQPHQFWSGCVVPDEDYAHRHHEESDVTETTRLTTFLPAFGGFHGSRWENLFPFAREQCADRFARYEGADELTGAELGAILRETSDAARFFASLARAFCLRYADVSGWLGFELGLTFSDFDIPTSASGTTDFILATMPLDSARKLLARSAEEGHGRLRNSIRDRFAPGDDADPNSDVVVEQWLAEPIERWGRAALCDLLAGFVDPEIDERLYAEMTEGGDLRTAFEAAVDWERFAATADASRRALTTITAKA